MGKASRRKRERHLRPAAADAPADAQLRAQARSDLLHARRAGVLDPDTAYALEQMVTAPAASVNAAALGLLGAALADLKDAAEASAPLRAAVADLRAATVAGDDVAAHAAATLLADPAPLSGSLNDGPYPGLDLLTYEAVDALEQLWPDGVRPQIEALARTVQEELGDLGVDVLTAMVGAAVDLADWGEDAGTLERWLTARAPTTRRAVPSNDAVLDLATRRDVDLPTVIIVTGQLLALVEEAQGRSTFAHGSDVTPRRLAARWTAHARPSGPGRNDDSGPG